MTLRNARERSTVFCQIAGRKREPRNEREVLARAVLENVFRSLTLGDELRNRKLGSEMPIKRCRAAL